MIYPLFTMQLSAKSIVKKIPRKIYLDIKKNIKYLKPNNNHNTP